MLLGNLSPQIEEEDLKIYTNKTLSPPKIIVNRSLVKGKINVPKEYQFIQKYYFLRKKE